MYIVDKGDPNVPQMLDAPPAFSNDVSLVPKNLFEELNKKWMSKFKDKLMAKSYKFVCPRRTDDPTIAIREHRQYIADTAGRIRSIPVETYLYRSVHAAAEDHC